MSGKADGRTQFDLLEKRFVFIVSRIFFWILCGVASLALVAAIVLLIVNLVPAVKQKVATPRTPADVSVSLADVEQELAPAPPPEDRTTRANRTESTESSPKSAETPRAAAPGDTIDPVLRAKIDTLRALFPADKYSWESVYGKRPARTDYWGRVLEYQSYLVKRGLEYTLGVMLSLYKETPARVKVVEEATAVVAKFDVEKRGEAFQAYAGMRYERETDRQREINALESEHANKQAAAEMRFATEKARKARGAIDALRYAGAAFTGIALVGLFLCFLAIERNTRMLQAILERESAT